MIGKGSTAWWECILISSTTWNDTWLPHCREKTPTEGFVCKSSNKLWTSHWTIGILISILHFCPWVNNLPAKINPCIHEWFMNGPWMVPWQSPGLFITMQLHFGRKMNYHFQLFQSTNNQWPSGDCPSCPLTISGLFRDRPPARASSMSSHGQK